MGMTIDEAIIHTEGLDEGIRCAMCTNNMQGDRGCDGSCVVDNAMYKKVMDVIENHIADADKMMGSITKNDLSQERYQDLIEYFSDEKVAKTILEDRKEFKAWLKRLRWNVKRADELARELEQIKGTTKNDLGVDIDKLISDCEKMSFDIDFFNKPLKVVALDAVKNIVKELPSVTPQEPKTGHWIRTYGNVKCSVCGSVKDSREVGKATHYCDFCGAKMVEPQESEG